MPNRGVQMISKCRSCQSTKLESVIDLGNQMLSDFRDDDKKPKMVEHMHWAFNKAVMDPTYEKSNATAPADSATYQSRQHLWQ